jgi:DNA-binding CsgD family transcriptional regulator
VFVNYEEFFSHQIKQAPSFSIGPFYWFIGDNANMKITAASNNIGELTPFPKNEWVNNSAFFFAENIHTEDSFYVLSALQLAIAKIESLPDEKQGDVRVNIYARMLNAEKIYRWVLIQIPGLYIDKATRNTCGLIMVTDLSHFNFNGRPVMMTLTDKVNNKNEYFHIAKDEMKLINANLPNITKQEQKIFQLMAKGLNTPQISKELNISYSTVENHKRNLRKKTNTKTSAELVHYMMTNNLL